jgi:hypothetical protein
MLQTALSYVRRGWSVIPLKPRGKRPHFPLLPIKVDETGHPRRTWEPYQARLPTEEEVITWWELSPNANIGIVSGAVSGIIVLDLDGPEVAQHREIPTTPISLTGNGMHIFFRHRGARSFRLPGMDLKADGGYVVAPPSVHPSGRRYAWQLGPFIEPATPPDWLMETMFPHRIEHETPPVHRGSAYGRAALHGELNTLARTQIGARNNQLNRSAFSLGQLLAAGLLDRTEVEHTLTMVASAIGLGAREIQATLRSGLEAGMRHPRQVAR